MSSGSTCSSRAATTVRSRARKSARLVYFVVSTREELGGQRDPPVPGHVGEPPGGLRLHRRYPYGADEDALRLLLTEHWVRGSNRLLERDDEGGAAR